MPINVRNSGEKINLEELLVPNLSLSQFSTIHTGGKADLAAYPTDFEELRALLLHAQTNGLDVTILGGFSNSLISDEGIAGLTIITAHLTRKHIQGEMFCVRSGLSLDRAIDFALEAGLSGLEMLGGIPGSVGGAIYGNAGANGVQIGDLLYYVDYMTLDGKMHRMQIHSDDFSYRHSPFSETHDKIIYEAGFRLDPTVHTSEARKNKDDVKQKRKDKGHYENPSLGSIFANPPGTHAGQLIEECNLAGINVGGAMLSNRHCNFIINSNGKASSSDVHSLLKQIQAEVVQQKGILLRPEIQFIGRW
ncbi:UDP-N-acetylmuramate dehydrogenase [Sphaerochaeta sp. PS]|uniref:UDP-N-acetylmuramate dehydrogenase n=1 Tax=Sphaerochaeta sp. PS TaxID=3076336 RepID=UPI0028A477C9|nr:UDP-N-acetylmuramate dehydrogenase [Sphaerochaeta sp. PS]MDT4761768.1 UDP-N-acetylmuramate dehydrogenase [Sphaerochaeta sp. PS]